MISLVPPHRTSAQGVVVSFVVILDNLFQADIPPHFISGPVEEQQGEEAGHSTVSIDERMDAEEIENVCGDQQQRINFTTIP